MSYIPEILWASAPEGQWDACGDRFFTREEAQAQLDHIIAKNQPGAVRDGRIIEKPFRHNCFWDFENNCAAMGTKPLHLRGRKGIKNPRKFISPTSHH